MYSIEETRRASTVEAFIFGDTRQDVEAGIDAYFKRRPFAGYQTRLTEDVHYDELICKWTALLERWGSCD
jgi:hypothetical protein